MMLADSHDFGSLGARKLIFQDTVEHLNPCWPVPSGSTLHPSWDDIFAQHLASDRIVEQQQTTGLMPLAIDSGRRRRSFSTSWGR